MKKFVFKSRIEPVEICGKEYTFDTTNIDWVKKVMVKADEVKKEVEAVKMTNFSPEKIDKLVDCLSEAIEFFLGEGEFKRIYDHEDCNHSYQYLIQLTSFIMVEVKKQSGK